MCGSEAPTGGYQRSYWKISKEENNWMKQPVCGKEVQSEKKKMFCLERCGERRGTDRGSGDYGDLWSWQPVYGREHSTCWFIFDENSRWCQGLGRRCQDERWTFLVALPELGGGGESIANACLSEGFVWGIWQRVVLEWWDFAYFSLYVFVCSRVRWCVYMHVPEDNPSCPSTEVIIVFLEAGLCYWSRTH